ncbi:MAG: metal-dependent hydrolase, partial [Pseudomonadota bacterium]
RLETDEAVLLVDPWFTGNPVFPEGKEAEATAGATHILLTHAHGDHAGDAIRLARSLSVPVVGIYDLMGHWAESDGIETIGFNKGGTVTLGDVAATMVHATHSSSLAGPNGPGMAGSEAGFMLRAGGKTIYMAGDTDVMADMAVFEALHQPQIGILPIGGHFTMDGARAAFAARTYFNFTTIIPCHYKTFPLLAQDAEALKSGIPDPQIVREMDVMETITL